MIPHRPFFYTRHGQTDYNRDGLMQGSIDIPLNETGLRQAAEAAAKMQGHAFDLILCSPLTRARQTAAALQTAFPGKPLLIDEGLVERHFGSGEGQVTAQLRVQYNWPEGKSMAHFPIPDAEPWEAFQTRALRTVEQGLQAHPDHTVVFVGHGAFFRALFEGLNLPPMAGEAKQGTPYLFLPTAEGGWELHEVSAA